MSPIGTFLPWDETDVEGRFFARPSAFDMECPACGRLCLVGNFRPDNKHYNRVTGILWCPQNDRPGKAGCGRSWLIGIVAYQIRGKERAKRPADQRPNPSQLAQLRDYARGVWSRHLKRRGEPINVVRRDPDDPGEPREED